MKHWYNYWLNIAIGFILLISIAMFIFYIINVSTKFHLNQMNGATLVLI